MKLWRGTDLVEKWGGPAKVPTVEELRDHHAISMLAKIYALGVDLYDPELCRSAFATDATAAMGEDGEMVPIEEHLSMIHQMIGAFESTQHLIAQQYIRTDGDAAEMWSYGLGVVNRRVVSGQQYRDTCRRDEQGWLITARRVHVHWVEPI